VDFNLSARETIPLISESMVSKNISEFIDYDGRIKRTILTDKECRIKMIHNSSVRHYRVSSSPLMDESGQQTGYILAFIDITELVDAMAELTELASVDTLTKTHTRRYFIQRTEIELSRAKRHSHPLSFIILDLDYFKNINDEYGHLAGDAMLQDIARICEAKIRSIDLLGRFGGEEFMLLLPETDLEGAIFVAERIRKTIEETKFTYENNIMSMTVSLGVTGADKITGQGFDILLKCGDRALYKAKANGRNRVECESCGSLSQKT
jgi:diguanylate cyclase (GGDEF)-like protein